MKSRNTVIAATVLLIGRSFLGSQETSGYPETHPPFPAGKPTSYDLPPENWAIASESLGW